MNKTANHSDLHGAPPRAVAEVGARLHTGLAPLLAAVAHFRFLFNRISPLWSRIARVQQLFDQLLTLLDLFAAGRFPPAPGARTSSRLPAPNAAPAEAIGAPINAWPFPPLSLRRAWRHSRQAPAGRMAGTDLPAALRSAVRHATAPLSSPPQTACRPFPPLIRAAMRRSKRDPPKSTRSR